MWGVKDAENGTKIRWIKDIHTLATENANMKAILHTMRKCHPRNGSTQDTVARGKGWMTKTSPQQSYLDCKSTAPVNNKTGAVHSD